MPGEIVVSPVASVLKYSASPGRNRVLVRPAILFPLLHYVFVDDRIEMRIQPAVMDPLIIVLPFLFGGQSMRLAIETEKGSLFFGCCHSSFGYAAIISSSVSSVASISLGAPSGVLESVVAFSVGLTP